MCCELFEELKQQPGVVPVLLCFVDRIHPDHLRVRLYYWL